MRMKKLVLTVALAAGLVSTLGFGPTKSLYGCWQSLCDEICGGPNSGICVYSTCVCP